MNSTAFSTPASKPMRVFVTGATGFVGSAVVRDLLQAGHSVLGLARSAAGAKTLLAAGADVHRGEIEDLAVVQRGAEQSEGVIHLAFNHDFSQYVANCEYDRSVIAALGSVLTGSGRPLVITSATAMVKPTSGQPAKENDPLISSSLMPRSSSEEAGIAAADRGVNVSVVRLAQIHDPKKQGLVSELIKFAREKKVSAFVGHGDNRWPAAHLLTTAQLYRLAVEKQEAGAKYHAVVEEGVTLREIAHAIGRGLNLPVVSLSPETAATHFGWLSKFVCSDLPASSTQTQKKLNWNPSGPGMIADLEQLQF